MSTTPMINEKIAKTDVFFSYLVEMFLGCSFSLCNDFFFMFLLRLGNLMCVHDTCNKLSLMSWLPVINYHRCCCYQRLIIAGVIGEKLISSVMDSMKIQDKA
jgi:hypothetical protein